MPWLIMTSTVSVLKDLKVRMVLVACISKIDYNAGNQPILKFK